MDFRILGPLEVVAGSERLELGGARQEIVLAMLLLSAGNAVSVGRLQEAIYGENLPPTSRNQVQISISSLRRLFASHGRDGTISTWGQGYVLRVGTATVDWRRFEDLTAAAKAERGTGHLDRAVAGYRDALRLWRGPALEGIDSQLVHAAAARLDEQHIATNEDRLALELDLGRHHELVGELTELAGEFPLREGLRGQLMLALYRCGRTAEALQVYRHARQTMVEDLGIEPGESLQRLEHAILNADPDLDLPTAPVVIQPAHRPVPGLLPADIADFTGRAEQVDQVCRHLTGPVGQEWPALPVVVIGGRGGAGKTSIAVHASHGVAGHFADGQLFADLHGGTAHPVSPGQVLERFLRALGVPGAQIPDGLDERAEVYRNLLADRKILVVLDDAIGESQVLPLLPGSAGAAVIVTSRNRLAGLAGASHVEVGVLDADTSLDLLARIAGSARVQTESAAAAAVADQCGHLPLALRIAGARLAARPHWSIEQLAERLADETRRLDELSHGDLGVRANISLTYDSASDQEWSQRAHRGRVESQVLCRMGEAYVLAGELAGAVSAFESALAKVRDLADPIGESYVLSGLGIAKVRQGELDQARTALQRSLELAAAAGERLAHGRALLGLSELALSTGDPGQAVARAQQAADAFHELGTPLFEARALTLLSQAYAALDDHAAASAASARAVALRAPRAGTAPIG